jgi:small subunit ribosomal protein S2
MVSTMKDLLECGVHFGHQKRKWNPKMKKYIFGLRKNVYILDLQQTTKFIRKTYEIVKNHAAEGKTVLFVGTKKQASDHVRDFAKSCNMPYINHRWLGGTLTNFGTIKKSIKKMKTIGQMEETGTIDLLTKKEALILKRKKAKLGKYFEGIADMQKLPDMIFVIDTVKEHIAIEEARRLGIPVVAPIDTNCDPDVVDFPIPGNDDAIRSIKLFCNEISSAINEGVDIAKESEAIEESKEDSKEENKKTEEKSEVKETEKEEK